MRAFRVPFASELDRIEWWWRLSPLEKVVFLQLFWRACEGTTSAKVGCVWIGPVGIASWVGPEVTSEAVGEAYKRLVEVGALVDVSGVDERWHYRIEGFERFSAAADTYRSKARAQYRRVKELRAAKAEQ